MDFTYISIDVETDGPSVVENSLLSLGAVVAGRQSSGEYSSGVELEQGIQVDFAPVTEHWDPAALEATGIDRRWHEAEGVDPEAGMKVVEAWIERVSEDTVPVMVGYAVAFDWMFVTAYMHRYRGGSPFHHSRYLDIKSVFVGGAPVEYGNATRAVIQDMCLREKPTNSHVALEDAIEQAHLFNGVMATVTNQNVTKQEEFPR